MAKAIFGRFGHSDATARVVNGIRDPGNPSRKRCELGVGGLNSISAEANAISSPPGDYGRKVKTQRIDGARTSSGACGLIRCYTKNLTQA